MLGHGDKGGVQRGLEPQRLGDPGLQIVGLLCPERLCAPRLANLSVLDDTGHITIRGRRAIREVLARSARLAFGEVPPKK
jgi:hypothetical protein